MLLELFVQFLHLHSERGGTLLDAAAFGAFLSSSAVMRASEATPSRTRRSSSDNSAKCAASLSRNGRVQAEIFLMIRGVVLICV
jgi:hypothetical protein